MGRWMAYLSFASRRNIIAVLVVGLVPLVAASAISFFFGRTALRRVVGASQRDLAIEVMDKIDRELSFALNLQTHWASLPVTAQTMQDGRNTSPEALEAEWTANGLTQTPTALLLRQFEALTENRLREIILTDSRGHIVAASNKTTDFDQGPADDPPAGEPWWASAMKDGLHIGPVQYDESADVYSFKIARRVDRDGVAQGVLMALYNMENIRNLVGAASKGETWQYELVNSEGLIVAAQERARLLRPPVLHLAGHDSLTPKAIGELLGERAGFTVGTDGQGSKVLVSYARSARRIGEGPWLLLSQMDLDEAYSLLYQQLSWFFFVFAVAGGGILLVAFRRVDRERLEAQHERDRTRALLAQEQRRRREVRPHDIERWTLDDFVETSPAMKRVLGQVRELQRGDAPALIAGEPGTGKELLARAIHAGSARGAGAFVPVRCASLPVEVAESLPQRTAALSQLFGHVRGSFAGADTDRVGLLQQAKGGTLFLDEVDLLPLPLQAHLLRVLHQREVKRMGEAEPTRIDVRVLAATNQDLEAWVEAGGFHRELYAYLATHRVQVPPLRARVEDVAPLAQRVADRVAHELGVTPPPLRDDVLEALCACALPGNARQLRQLLEQALRARGGGPIGPSDHRLS